MERSTIDTFYHKICLYGIVILFHPIHTFIKSFLQQYLTYLSLQTFINQPGLSEFQILIIQLLSKQLQKQTLVIKGVKMPSDQQIQLNYKEIDSLQKQFQQILVELAGDQSLVRFKHQYDKLYRALKRSHDNEKILYNKITQLSRDMANQTAKLRMALKLSQEDAQAIAYLKQQLQKTFKVLQLSKERQQRAKQKIQAMNSKIKVLQSNLQQFQALSQGQSNAINQLKQRKQRLTRQKDQLNDGLAKVKSQLSQNYEKLRQVDGQKANIQSAFRSLEKDINEIDQKLRKDEGRKAKIQEELDNLTRQKDSSLNESNKFKDEIAKLHEAINKKEYLIQEAKSEEQNICTLFNQKEHQVSRLREQYINQAQYKTYLNKQNSELDSKTEMTKKECNLTIMETTRLEKQIDKCRNELVNAKEALNVTKKENQILLNSVPQISREILDRKKLNTQDKDEIETLDRERNTLQKQLLRFQTQFKQYNQKLLQRQKQILNNQQKISQGNSTIQTLNKQILKVLKEKQTYGKKAALANTKYLQTLEQIKLKGNLISEYQKKNIETESKLKDQQQLYQNVRSDRNTYSKSLSQTEDEIAELKRRYKIVNHQINQLKQEIQAKQVALAKEHFQHKKKDQTLLQHSRELQKRKKQMDERREQIKNCFNEISKLHYTIKESQNKRQHRKDQYELIVAERDILGTQLIRRNDQSALLYEKIKIQQTTLAKGQTAFRERLADLKLLQYKKQDVKRQLKILMKESNKIPNLKNDIFNIQSQLIQQKLKVKALSEQLQNPLNIHRCRNLEGTDPDVYQMKEKIKTLQKRLIFKTQQVVEKQVLIHQKSKQVQEIREIMKKQPGLEVAEKLSIMQRNLTTKTSKLKQLAAQINMYQAKTNQYKFDIERTQKQIQQIRRKYNEQKKRQLITKDNQKILQQI